MFVSKHIARAGKHYVLKLVTLSRVVQQFLSGAKRELVFGFDSIENVREARLVICAIYCSEFGALFSIGGGGVFQEV